MLFIVESSLSVMTVGHVHGRFQPFHDEHAAYVEWANNQCDQLIIGITNADPLHTVKEDTDPNRHRPENNPYSYFERHIMIDSYIKSNGWDNALICPFPINKPDLWEEYAPQSVTHYINVVEEWDQQKAERIRRNGRKVVTKQGRRSISGTSIRQQMRTGENWEMNVPDPVASKIKSSDLILE